MKPTGKAASEPSRDDVQAALAAMGADELREVVREMMLELDDRAHGRVASAIIRRGASGGSGWVPAALDDTDVAEAVAFAQAATRVGHADPADVDERLRRGVAAFLRKDYASAHRILGALLRPISEAEIDLGEHETVDEVLGVAAHDCAVQYVVSAYMTSEPARRAQTVRTAIDEVRGVGCFFEPIREMERAATEPLPGLADFLPQWRAVAEREAAGGRHSDWDREADRWLREVVRRIEGSDGLANVARATRRADDLRAWCDSLAEAGDWKAALSAFEEAAVLVTDRESARGRLLDGAALAALGMGNKDVSPWLERAWRAEPTMPRLCRWLGGARTKQSMHERVAEALQACPEQAQRQLAFLHLLQGDVEQAAALLAQAPGLGWSNGEHPGHLIFPLFQARLGGNGASLRAIAVPGDGMDVDEDESPTCDGDDEPELPIPKVDEILRDAGVEGISEAKARKVVLAAMRKAAEVRVAAVTDQRRRRQYGHAASLVAACIACDGSPETGRWAATLRGKYRRFPALCAELDRRVGSA